MEDDLLYARSIQEGDKVYLDEENKLDKALDEDWTSKCMVRTMDTAAFVDRLQAVKAGRPVEWKCPFCGRNNTMCRVPAAVQFILLTRRLGNGLQKGKRLKYCPKCGRRF